MKFNEKLAAAVAAAIAKTKELLTAAVPVRYREKDVLEAGITRPYKSKKEQRDIEAIRADLKRKALIKERIAIHKKTLGL
jgi:hypothetical protein